MCDKRRGTYLSVQFLFEKAEDGRRRNVRQLGVDGKNYAKFNDSILRIFVALRAVNVYKQILRKTFTRVCW